ncbi:putative transmembrane protein [Cupriavidus necator]|uniref:Putative transmembrane protein n=2 Tax=Cupriavidus necator TaxID=106590 RepID=A0A1K0JC90_CUPNE|nr:putative transmembrane protein [Cupriavidus necator]
MRSITGLVIAAAALLPAVASAQVIQTGPGPGGNIRITTPWGDYIAIRQAGTLFVVTEEQYAKGLIKDYAASAGHEEVSLAGIGKTYISKNDVRVQVGGTTLRQVSASIVIGVPADRKLGRPPKPRASEYVQIVWVQQGPGKFTANLSVDGRAIKPNTCGADMGFYHCEFTVSHGLIPKPAEVVFTERGKAPGLWQVASLSQAHYAELQRKYAELKAPMGAEDAADLAAVRKIDPSIGGEIK